ncbi:MAG: DNA glycosylase [Benjaminiella poitrasii]|nr:MAG: DNA glycosylase [Benjaminiella poitrasii]
MSIKPAVALRKSSRLLNKPVIEYKEKKIFSLRKINKKSIRIKKEESIKIKNEDKKKVIVTKKTTEITSNQPSPTFDISEEVHLKKAVEHFKKHDARLGAYLTEETIKAFKNKLSKQENILNPFRSLARAIMYQQIHGKAASSIYSRFINLFKQDNDDEDWFPEPKDVLKKSFDELKSAGLSTRKVEYIRNLAEKLQDKTITPEKFDTMTDQEISKQLCSVKGIGQWTVDMFLMLDLRHPDVLPLGDLVVRKGIASHFGITPISSTQKKAHLTLTEKRMLELTDIWRPYRSLGAWLMWKAANTKIV